MATDTYGDAVSTQNTYDDSYARERTEPARAERYMGETIFLWVAWTLAFVFWAFFMSTFFGIFHELGAGAPGGLEGGADAGGLGFLMMDVIGGVVLLGGALAWGEFRTSRRNRSLDPATEASTAALYDRAERRGGDDRSARSPEAREPLERDSYRPA